MSRPAILRGVSKCVSANAARRRHSDSLIGLRVSATFMTTSLAKVRCQPLEFGHGQIGRAHAELQSLMRISYAVFCLKNKNQHNTSYNTPTPDSNTLKITVKLTILRPPY